MRFSKFACDWFDHSTLLDVDTKCLLVGSVSSHTGTNDGKSVAFLQEIITVFTLIVECQDGFEIAVKSVTNFEFEYDSMLGLASELVEEES